MFQKPLPLEITRLSPEETEDSLTCRPAKLAVA